MLLITNINLMKGDAREVRSHAPISWLEVSLFESSNDSSYYCPGTLYDFHMRTSACWRPFTETDHLDYRTTMTQELSGVTIVIFIAAGVLTILLLFIFAKRQITRVALRSRRGPHVPIGHDAKKVCSTSQRVILRLTYCYIAA